MDFDNDEELSALTINQDYAQQYERKKQGEELNKLKEKYGSDYEETTEESEDEDEDEEAELVTPQVDAQILRVMTAIKSKDPKVYEDRTDFFSEQQMEEAKRKWQEKMAKKKREKPILLKDYHRKLLLEDGGFIEEEKEVVEKTHAQEQEELKSGLKKAISAAFDEAEEEEEDGDLFTVKKKSTEEEEAEEEDYKRFLLESLAASGSSIEEFNRWNNYKNNPEISADDQFLMDYILNRGWMDHEVGKTRPSMSIIREQPREIDFDEDEEAIEAAEKFESEYNFRFEEAAVFGGCSGGGELITHARQVEGSIRRQDNTRALERKRREERKAEEKQAKVEEIKRMKNLQKKVILEKLEEIKKITGINKVEVDSLDLLGDFDPSNYDAQMQQLFNDDYYDQQSSDKNKPEFENDIDISDLVDPSSLDNHGDDNVIVKDEEVVEDESDKRSRKRRKKELLEKKKQELNKDVARYNELGYADIIDGKPIRFKYCQVEPETYGLRPEEILLAEDKELNEYISLKKLAPYRKAHMEKQGNIHYKRIKELREKLKDRYGNKYY